MHARWRSSLSSAFAVSARKLLSAASLCRRRAYRSRGAEEESRLLGIPVATPVRSLESAQLPRRTPFRWTTGNLVQLGCSQRGSQLNSVRSSETTCLGPWLRAHRVSVQLSTLHDSHESFPSSSVVAGVFCTMAAWD